MRTCLIAALLFCGGIGAQPLSVITPPVYLINAGGPDIPASTDSSGNAIPEYTPDQFFSGGVAWVDPTMGVGIWGTLRYAPFFTYDIPVPNGIYSLKFDLLEPNRTGPKQRIFTITANGVTTDPIDLFAMTGAINVQTSVSMLAMVGNGHLRITFQATLSNAVVSAIEVNRAYFYSGLNLNFFRVSQCPPPLTTSVCIVVNPTGTQ